MLGGTDGKVIGLVGFTKADSATMESTYVPIQLIAEVLWACNKEFEEIRMVFAVVGLLNIYCGEYMCS